MKGRIVLTSISIRTKIAAVLTFLLLAMASMGFLAIQKMQAINGNTVDIAQNWLPSIRLLGELRAGVVNYRNNLREHMLAETTDAKALVEKRLDQIVANNNAIRAQYEKVITSPEERAIYDEWATTWESYKKLAGKVMALSRAAAGKSANDAHEFHSTQASEVGVRADELLARDIKLNDDGAASATLEAAKSYTAAFWIIVGVLIAAVIVGAAIGVYLVKDVAFGIASIVRPMQLLGSGDLSAVVPFQGLKTEIGQMGDALQVFKQALIDKRAADEAASVEAEAKIERGRRVDEITRSFEAMITEIVQTVSSASTELEASAGTLTSTAERSQELTTAVAAASEEASTNVQSVASATEEMASSIHEISRQVQESATIAANAVDQARRTNERVSELASAASRIGDVVELINTIAGQTNLLALNATIEAARAGDAGRGFAVVASEVKALAEQTAKATGEISIQISGIQAATQDSVGAIKEISNTIGRMSEIASTIASAVEEQGAATQEISRNVQQAAQGTMEVSANITDVQRGATETGSASTQVFSAARSLSRDSDKLKVQVDLFLSNVRAA